MIFALNGPSNYITLLYFSLIANGDLISPVVRLLIPRKTLNHWDHILEMVTAKVSLRSGAVHRYQEAEYLWDTVAMSTYVFKTLEVDNGSCLLYGNFLCEKTVFRGPFYDSRKLEIRLLQISFLFNFHCYLKKKKRKKQTPPKLSVLFNHYFLSRCLISL